eukprot:5018256-Prymnesium_polylepis.2
MALEVRMRLSVAIERVRNARSKLLPARRLPRAALRMSHDRDVAAESRGACGYTARRSWERVAQAAGMPPRHERQATGTRCYAKCGCVRKELVPKSAVLQHRVDRCAVAGCWLIGHGRGNSARCGSSDTFLFWCLASRTAIPACVTVHVQEQQQGARQQGAVGRIVLGDVRDGRQHIRALGRCSVDRVRVRGQPLSCAGRWSPREAQVLSLIHISEPTRRS